MPRVRGVAGFHDSVQVVAGMMPADIVSERSQLVRALRTLGPEAPTLAGAWSAAEIARHLASQDRLRGVPAYLARRIIVATGWRLTAGYLDRPLAAALVNVGRRDWNVCLRRLDRAPPRPVMTPSIATITLWEHVVHHEDIRRPANVARNSWPDLSPVIDWLMSYNGRRLETHGIRLVATDGGEWSTHSPPRVSIHGALSELVLWLSGRGAAADIETSGDSADLAAIARTLAI